MNEVKEHVEANPISSVNQLRIIYYAAKVIRSISKLLNSGKQSHIISLLVDNS